MNSVVPTIRSIRARGFDVPTRQPFVTAAGTLTTLPIVIIDLETEEGVTGTVYIFAYERYAMRPLAQLVEGIGSLLIGRRLHPLSIEEYLQQRLRILGAQGLTGMALGGVDLVVWDTAARALELPLSVMLGADPSPVPAYFTLKNMTTEGAANDAVNAVEKGFLAVKVKLGGKTVDEDVAVVKAIRAATGGQVKIMVDYNQVLSVPEAVMRGRVLDEHHVEWIEEPTRAQDFDGHAEIARQVTTPISLGENLDGAWDAGKALAAGACDYIMPDAMKIGGVTGWMRTASLAATHGIPMSGHALPELSIQLLAATPTRHWLEYAEIAETVLTEPLQISSGCAVVPQRPGFGLEWDKKALQAAG